MFKSITKISFSFFLLFSIQANAQLLYQGGRFDGSNSTRSNVQKLIALSSGEKLIAGTFQDSLKLNFASSTPFPHLNPGVKGTFLASYNSSGYVNAVIISGTSAGDSVVVKDMVVDGSDNIYISGSLYGTADFGSFTFSAIAGGADGFIAKYNPSFGFEWLTIIEGSGSIGCVNALVLSGSILYAGGYFNGTVDLDYSGGYLPATATAGVDGFIADYDITTGNPSSSLFGLVTGSGTEKVLNITTNFGSDIYFTALYDGSVDVDPTASVTGTTSLGGSDIALAKWDYLYNHMNSVFIGGIGNEKPIGIKEDVGNMAILFDFENVVSSNPGLSLSATSLGGTDVGLFYFDGNFDGVFGRSVGNAGNDHAHFLGVEPIGGGAKLMGENFIFTLSFQGTLDVDPGANTLNITSTGTGVNSVAISIDLFGYYFNHITNEAASITGIAFEGFGPMNDVTIVGDFNGNNVDLLPMDSVLLETHTTNLCGYYVNYHRCDLVVDLSVGPFECGTNTASITATVSNSGGYVNYYWSTSEVNSTINELYDGYYYVDIMDGYGCTAYPNITIGHYYVPPTSVTVTPVNSSCGNSIGSASAVVADAIGTYSYIWSNGDTTATADSLPAGFYTVQVLDESGCYVQESFSIADVDGPVINLNSVTNPLCGGTNIGAIDISISGGAAPLELVWSNGQTTEDLTGLPAGSYSLVVTDAGGCTNQICVDITAPDPLGIYVINQFNSFCGGSVGAIMISPVGGVAPYSISWDASAGFSTNDTLIGLTSGLYTATVTDNNGCTYSETFGISDDGGPWVYFNSEIPASCSNSNLGSTFVDIVVGSGSYNFTWSNGATTEDLLNVPGGKHVLLVDDLIWGCKTAYTTYLTSIIPNVPSICMVTVDSTGTQNVVVYDESSTPEADYYKIYREGVCGSSGFVHIGSRDRDSLSAFYDTVVNSDTRSWKYYVTAVDSCGNESGPSVINKTIHLSLIMNASNDIVCNWEPYQGQIINGYTVYRRNVAGTAFDSILQVSPTTVSWTDTIDFSAYSDIDYYVEAIPQTICNASKAYNQNAARSNTARIMIPLDTTGSSVPTVILDDSQIKLFPNPTNGHVTVAINGVEATWNVALFDTYGRIAKNIDIRSNQVVISTNDLTSGVYVVKLQSHNGLYRSTQRLIVAK